MRPIRRRLCLIRIPLLRPRPTHLNRKQMVHRVSRRNEVLDDRRLHNRLPIEREVRYRTLAKGIVPHTGLGKMLDMSSAGALFTTESHIPSDTPIEVAVSWPVLLDNVTPLKLVLRGRVVRSGESQAAMSIESYEFKTVGSSGI